MNNLVTERIIKFMANGTAKYTLCYPKALIALTLADLKTIYRYMVEGMSDNQENVDAVLATHNTLEQLEEYADKAVKEATTAYANGFRYEDEYYYTRHERQEIARNNKKLEASIKSAKHNREKIKKRQALLNEVYSSYCLNVK